MSQSTLNAASKARLADDAGISSRSTATMSDDDVTRRLMRFVRIVEPPIRQWRLVVTLMAVTALITSVAYWVLPRTYSARALIGYTKVISEVSLGSAIKTIQEDQANSTTPSTDRKARLLSFAQMIENANVAQIVIAEMGSKLPPELRGEAQLLQLVDGSLINGTDTLQIRVRYRDPVLAADIANAWARGYVRHINSVYASRGAADALESMNKQTVEAKATYDQAQVNYLAFTRVNEIDELSRQIREKQAVVDTLSAAKATAISNTLSYAIEAQQRVISGYLSAQSENQMLSLSADQDIRRSVLESYVSALKTTRSAAFTEQVQTQVTELQQAYANKRQTQQWLITASGMLTQVQTGGDAAAASNILALTLLKAQIYSGGTGNLQDFPEAIGQRAAAVTASSMANDLNALIASLNVRLTDADKQIDTLTDQLLTGDAFKNLNVPLADSTNELAKAIEARYAELYESGKVTELGRKANEDDSALRKELSDRVQALLKLQGMEQLADSSVADTPLEKQMRTYEQEVRALQAKVAEQSDKLQELTRARDLAWETYKTLATKATELTIASQATGTELSVGASANVPSEPESRLPLLLAIVAVALVMGLMLAYGVELAQRRRGREPFALTWRMMAGRRELKIEN